jgi:exopolysaccharide biosynthesis polyprenyl glycosylphosphotransferase
MADSTSQLTDSTEVIFPSRVSTWIPLPRLRLRFSERKILLGLSDLLMLSGALLVVLWLRWDMPLSWQTILARPQWFALLALIWLLVAPTFDAYNLKKAARLPESVSCVIKSALLTLLLYFLIPYITPHLVRSRLTMGLFLTFSLSFLCFGRALYAVLLVQPLFSCRALVVGAGWAGRTILQALKEHGDSSYHVVGFVDDDPQKQGQLIQGLPVLGTRQDLVQLAKAHDISTVILAITHDIHGQLCQALTDCLEQGMQIVAMSVLYEEITGRVPVEHIGNNLYLTMPLDPASTGVLYPLLKRLMDIFLAGIGLLGLAIIFPFLALAIYVDSPGPILYTQERVGKGGKTFRFYKFRSMVPDAEKEGQAVWALENDHRVTRVGRILRGTHIDEFPQFFNILKGEMSAVGPRPERPEFVAELEKKIPFYRTRHCVRPGMAGWGLVKQGYGASEQDALLKLQYDLYYIKHQSVRLDIVILLKTILDTVTLQGR